MKPRLFEFLVLIVVCVNICNGFSISREANDTEASAGSSKFQKRNSQTHKKYKPPVVIEKKRVSAKKKIKISELKPCISKAFCEVNSITEEPTYETTKEFYLILSRLKKYTEINERDLNGSGSMEEDSGSSEESYEHEPYQPYNPHRSGPPPQYSPFRRGKSVSDAKKVKKHKKVQILEKLANGTEIIGPGKNVTKRARILSPAQIEKRAFVDKKAHELNVVDDLAALIKISAEIGQALRSPRRCRILFRKCQMSYDQIIRVFNKTQAVEKSAALPKKSFTTTTTTTTQEPSTTEQSSSSTSATNNVPNSDPETVLAEEENISGNRDKRERTDFSDEDLEYVLDTEESQPVKTYSLFAPSASEKDSAVDAERTEAIVDEAFKKFEKVFPSGDRYHTKSKDSKSKNVKTSSEEETSNESGADDKYQHRSSAENDNQDSEEVEMEVPPKKIKNKYSSQAVELAADVGETEDDSDVEIASSEIAKRPEDDQEEPSEEASEEVQNQQVYPTDEEDPYGNGGYQYVQPAYSSYQKPTKREKTKKNKKGNKKSKKNKKKGIPEDDEESQEAPEPPPPSSQFYQYIKQVNDGKGADTIPESHFKKGKGKKNKGSKKKPAHTDYQQYGEIPETVYAYPNPNQDDYNKPSNSPPPSFFQSIMGWFSRGSKSTGGSSEQHQTHHYNPGGYGQQQPQPYGETYGNPSNYPVGGGNYAQNSYDREAEYEPSNKKSSNKRPPQGRGNGEESSEEAEDEEEEEDEESQRTTTKREVAQKRPQSSPNKSHHGISVAGPPPPLVIVPPGEEPDYPSQRPVSNNKPQNNKRKQEKEQEASEESRETSSEEEYRQKQKQKSQKSKIKNEDEQNQVFSGIFASAAEIDKQQQKEKQQEAKENANILLSTFDSITNSFSTSADKITDWSEEDNAKNKVKVASLVNNGHSPNGRYKVNKNRNKNKVTASVELQDKEEKGSSEEEEDKK